MFLKTIFLLILLGHVYLIYSSRTKNDVAPPKYVYLLTTDSSKKAPLEANRYEILPTIVENLPSDEFPIESSPPVIIVTPSTDSLTWRKYLEARLAKEKEKAEAEGLWWNNLLTKDFGPSSSTFSNGKSSTTDIWRRYFTSKPSAVPLPSSSSPSPSSQTTTKTIPESSSSPSPGRYSVEIVQIQYTENESNSSSSTPKEHVMETSTISFEPPPSEDSLKVSIDISEPAVDVTPTAQDKVQVLEPAVSVTPTAQDKVEALEPAETGWMSRFGLGNRYGSGQGSSYGSGWRNGQGSSYGSVWRNGGTYAGGFGNAGGLGWRGSYGSGGSYGWRGSRYG